MNNIFGTDGVRACVGQSPLTFTALPLLGYAIGAWAYQQYGTNAQLLIARDTRASGDWITSALSNGLLLHPVTLYNAGILPTPALCYLLKKFSSTYNAGIVISASHNHYQDNGIKIIDHTAHKISTHAEEFISAAYSTDVALSYSSYGMLSPYDDAARDYYNALITIFAPSFLHGITVVLDCAHGATYQLAPLIFSKLGAHVITINANPNGSNINNQCGSLHVEQLQNAVRTHKATIGFAFDGDGDRVTAVTNTGIIKNGDDMLALLSNHTLYKDQTTVVATIMSNLGLDHYLRHQGKHLIRTKVGDKYIANHITKHQLLLGGEQSGHIILHDYLPTGDGIFTALRLCEVMITTNNWTLETFSHYPQIIINVPVNSKKDLTDPEIASIIKDHEAQLSSGRLIIRYSGTENMLRIMIEDQNRSAITKIGTTLAHTLQKYLQ